MKNGKLYRCRLCGQVVEVVSAGAGDLVCCGEPMTPLTGSTTDGAVEKHLPVMLPVAGGVMVKVGAEPHPMRPEHWIEWIEVLTGNSVFRQELNPESAPEALFPIPMEMVTEVRIYCNLHGLWKKSRS